MDAIALVTPLVEVSEGFRSQPYLDAVGIPTVGFGTVIPSLDHPDVTLEEARGLMQAELTRDAMSILRLCPCVALEPVGRMAALLDFVYNLGAGRLQASTLRRYINAGCWSDAALEFPKWVFAGARQLPGLVIRRHQEVLLFTRP